MRAGIVGQAFPIEDPRENREPGQQVLMTSGKEWGEFRNHEELVADARKEINLGELIPADVCCVQCFNDSV